MAKVKTDAEALRTVPPRDFIQARNALAERLTKRGDTAEARRIRRLRRPSPVVWALNGVAARHPDDLRALASVVDRLRRAQLGEGEVSGPTDQYRQAFQRLLTRANGMLREGNQVVTPALERRMRSTLQAAVADRRLRRDLQSAQLGEEHSDPGFAVFTRGPIPTEFLRPSPKAQPRTRLPTDSPPTARPSAGAISARREKATRKVEARYQAQAARETRKAAKATKALARDAERQTDRLKAAERRVEAARKALQDQERIAAQMREQADEARRRYEQRADQVLE
jgi:hypothetical protein